MALKNPLFEFYKELYFHEIEVREQLNARIQIPVALIASLAGALTFMLLKLDEQVTGWMVIGFVFFLVLSVVMLIVSAYFLIRTWVNHTYSFLPTASKTEDYRQELIRTYEGYDEDYVEQYLHKYLCDYFINCSSKNTNVNDQRSLYLHRSNMSLVAVIVSSAIAFSFFYFAEIDNDQIISIKKPQAIFALEIAAVSPSENSNNSIELSKHYTNLNGETNAP